MATCTQTYTGEITIIECCSCHMDFGMTPAFERARRKDHGWFYCPVGHPQHFSGRSTEEKLRAQLAAQEGEATAQRARAQRAELRRRAAQGQVTKIKNRIGKGVCPCCNRHFENVERHMATQHPSYADAQ